MLWKGEVRQDLHVVYEAQGKVAEGIQTKGGKSKMGRRGEHLQESCGEQKIEEFTLFSSRYSQKASSKQFMHRRGFLYFFAHSLIVIY